MTLFESLKASLDPGITPWQSNIATIAFGGLLATALASIKRALTLPKPGA
jgi:hypothetical protein